MPTAALTPHAAPTAITCPAGDAVKAWTATYARCASNETYVLSNIKATCAATGQQLSANFALPTCAAGVAATVDETYTTTTGFTQVGAVLCCPRQGRCCMCRADLTNCGE